MNAYLTLNVADMPEVLWSMMHQMAETLRAAADEEPHAHTQQRLLQLADQFEAGCHAVEWPEQES